MAQVPSYIPAFDLADVREDPRETKGFRYAQILIPSLIAVSGVGVLLFGLQRQNEYLDAQVRSSFQGSPP